ncbi:hypothetical protein P153DRAFT_349202 [Dothidotthia symphoricarpi CBS 119687]|uniref:Uncharacterized protein n=1 Tax=Dothidotthia symphoricarpi CBS 119687 TaxID=1392245 RepID=A0A6A5ZZM8_9PLEO|nr:uncharacterized protein P153DRAFT_349202 [Dothidotthia symphoricarpi CBS 119687]KAF2125019.1 hypothetical protein P153DRAFT_349202 [Dothidotthia symphoricarpi CBS 119687]
MCDAIFTFGQRGSHFFQCPSHQDHTRLPQKLTTLLSSSQLQLVHHIALGFENSFLLTWRDASGQDRINSAGLPSELLDFLYARTPQGKPARSIPTLRCTLGPSNTSFFAQDGSACVWMNLPPLLIPALQSRIRDGKWTDRPRVVALGADADFVLITENHAAVWALDHYPTMAKLLEYSRLQDRGIRDVRGVVLHAYRYGAAVCMSRNGTLVFENLPLHELAGMQGMIEPVLQDTKALDWGMRDRGGRKEMKKKREEGEGVQKRPSVLQERAQMRREWSDHTQQFTAQAKGLKLSLSLSVSTGGFSRMLG